MKFYLTFGQKSSARNGWIEVFADDETVARQKVFDEYGDQWSGFYSENNFDKECFPVGKLGELK